MHSDDTNTERERLSIAQVRAAVADGYRPDADEDEGYDVYLYADGSEQAFEGGSDELVRGFPDLREAIALADDAVACGAFARAVVGEGEDVYEHHDTGER